MRRLVGFALAWACAVFAGGAHAQEGARALLARGDAAWERRAEGHDGDGKAAPGPIAEAILAYERAADADPLGLEARWKLVRALHFAADFASAGLDEERSHLARATRETEAARALPPPSDVTTRAALHFWGAVAWGAWSQREGVLAAVREGVASRVHRDAEAAAALATDFEEGGPHRLLARLHASLPRLPLFSGWVDRERALPEIERALAIAPVHLGNRYLFALTLLDVAPARRDEALRVLAEVAAAKPRPAQLVEELAIRKLARQRLAAELGARGA